MADVNSTDTGGQDTLSPRHIAPGKETFWETESGLIVLVAEGRFFCAQRSVLCYESPIFRDMLSLPQSPVIDEKEQYEGKPLVRLSDSAVELQCFLEAIHHYMDYYETPSSASISSITAILRLSNKYDVHRLRKKTIRDLEAHLPTTLEQYDAWMDKSRKKQKDGVPGNLAIELEGLFSAVEESGTRRFFPFIEYRRCMSFSTSSHHGNDVVNSAVLTLLIRQLEMDHMVISSSCSDLRNDRIFAKSCAARVQSSFRDSLQEATDRQIDPLANTVPIFARLENSISDTDLPGQLCKHCMHASTASYQEKRLKLWDDLPMIFGLPPWEELLKVDGT